MDTNNEKELKVETIGIPNISSLSKQDYNQFIAMIEFQIREYYKNISPEKIIKPP